MHIHVYDKEREPDQIMSQGMRFRLRGGRVWYTESGRASELSQLTKPRGQLLISRRLFLLVVCFLSLAARRNMDGGIVLTRFKL